MPLHPGSSRKVISENIHEMVASGHPVKQAVAAALHNAHYKRKGRKLDHNAAAHDAGHPDHDELREMKMKAAMRGSMRDHAAEHMASDRLDRMGSHGREARMGRPRGS